MTEPTRRKSINWEKYTALCSMLVAACALIISIWQSYSIQQHNKLSLRPYLETEFNLDLDGSWELYLHNNGMGPAQVTALHYRVDGVSYHSREDFLVALGEEPDCYARGNIGRFYKVDDRQVAFRALQPACHKTVEDLNTMLSRIQIVVEYQSLYGELYQLLIGNTEVVSKPSG
ncbi:hypothetical protein QE250_04605 [Chromatiaceae bacterium AAb-1]|nr:hypothetical protein [Chromatiaceae bacterium AAb-1]